VRDFTCKATIGASPKDDRWLLVVELAAYLAASKNTVYASVPENRTPGYEFDRFRKSNREDFDDWIYDNCAASGLDADLKEKPDYE